MKNFKKNLPLLVILLLTVFLRFYQLGQNPPALSWDETAWGYNAYSLGLTGRDEFGRFLPSDYFESFGDFKPPVYAYLTILPVKVFGLNEFGVRFASAFFGSLTVLLTYFLVKELFSNLTVRGVLSATSEERYSTTHHPRCLALSHLGGGEATASTPARCILPLITSFLLAFSPWHIMLSRAAFEANVASFFLVAGVTLFLLGLRKVWFLPFSALSFALSFQTFNASRVVAPLLLLALLVAFRKTLWLKKGWLAVAFLSGFIVILPVFSFFLTPQARLRFREVNIFSDSSAVIVANQEMTNDNWIWWSKIIHNRRWGYARQYLRHYFDHFKPSFLFIKGDGNPKFSTQDVGELYLWELPFLITGVLLLLKRKPGVWWLIPVWLLVGIIPAATARETPHALRIETTLPTWQILVSLGLVAGWQWVKRQKPLIKKFLILVSGFLILLNFIYFQHGYWRHYRSEFSGEWQYGYRPAIEFVKTIEDEYDQIWFTNELGRPYIYFLFYLRKDPRQFWQEAVVEREVLGFVKVKSFGKYHFFRDKIPPLAANKVLVINTPNRVPDKLEPLEFFYLLNGQKILAAYEITQN